MWELQPLEKYAKRYGKWPKKHNRELQAMQHNLHIFLEALQSGQKPAAVKFGFIHPEPGGVLAIDQKGGGPHLKETRLYIYPDEARERLVVITIGDKDSQPQDIQTCNEFIQELRKEDIVPIISREKSHVQQQP
jgi:hypothetical protein